MLNIRDIQDEVKYMNMVKVDMGDQTKRAICMSIQEDSASLLMLDQFSLSEVKTTTGFEMGEDHLDIWVNPQQIFGGVSNGFG